MIISSVGRHLLPPAVADVLKAKLSTGCGCDPPHKMSRSVTVNETSTRIRRQASCAKSDSHGVKQGSAVAGGPLSTDQIPGPLDKVWGNGARVWFADPAN